ncbi:uncharacterized protein [Malus domestica]|uniref:uncharacterized protein n=1 Tax=Malus domestica TaxID=3750 RepID=UPI0039767AD4
MGHSVLENMEISMVHVIPTEFQFTTHQPSSLDGDVVAEEATQVDFVTTPEDESTNSDDKPKTALGILFPHSSLTNLQHLKPLYVTTHIEGYPVSKVFVDYGATVNIMPVNIMKTLRRSNDELIPSGITMSRFIGDKSQTKGMLRLEKPNLGVNLIEFLDEGDNGHALSFDHIQVASVELEDNWPQVKDPLEEINVGTADDPRPLLISALLPQSMKAELCALLEEFKDCFAWSYHEMPGLDGTLVKHKLRIKLGCKPFRQPPRRFSTEVQLGIKDELVQLLKVGFIRTARYVEWLANIVPVLKKNGALCICIDFRNLNLATPKDEYPMPILDLLIDAAANHAILSFMDGHAGCNQIFIGEADVHLSLLGGTQHIRMGCHAIRP